MYSKQYLVAISSRRDRGDNSELTFLVLIQEKNYCGNGVSFWLLTTNGLAIYLKVNVDQ